jgi:phage tail-like protein
MFNPNIAEAHFTEVSGFGINVQPIKYREGGSGQVVHSLPGMVEYEDITLRYGLTASHELWDWFMLAVSGKVQRRNVSIILLDADGVTPRLQWDLTNAWPRTWRGSVLNALSREVAIESLTLVFEELKRA